MRTVEEGPYLNVERVSIEPAVDELSTNLSSARDGVLVDRTVKEWVTADLAGESDE